MAALTQERDTLRRDGVDFVFPQAAGVTCYAGGMVMINASGYAVPGATATGQRSAGACQATSNSAGLAAGEVSVTVRRGLFRFGNAAGADAISLNDIGLSCYILDDQTVALTDGTGTRSAAGIIRDVDADGVWVEF